MFGELDTASFYWQTSGKEPRESGRNSLACRILRSRWSSSSRPGSRYRTDSLTCGNKRAPPPYTAESPSQRPAQCVRPLSGEKSHFCGPGWEEIRLIGNEKAFFFFFKGYSSFLISGFSSVQRWVALRLTAAYVNQDNFIHAKPPTWVNPTWFCLELYKGRPGKMEEKLLPGYLRQSLKIPDPKLIFEEFPVVNKGIQRAALI